LLTIRGNVELISRIIVVLFFAVGGLGAAAGLGGGAWYFTSHHQEPWLAVLLWPVFLFWQLFPLLATAFTENLDYSNLLRFPLSYPAYFAVRLAYGSFDPASLLGSLWLASIGIGIAVAQASLLLWAGAVMALFAATNLVLTRLVFALLERWLAQRRTREIVSILFFLLLVGLQFIGPLLGRYGEKSKRDIAGVTLQITLAQRVLPPGITARAISDLAVGRPLTASLAFIVLLAYSGIFLLLLNSRLRREYQGENLNEAEGVPTQFAHRIQPGWLVPGVPSATAAALEKELHYLSRSGPMLLTMIMPVLMLIIFRLGPAGHGGFLSRAPQYALPIGAAYSLLILTNFVYNNFGAEGAGVQFLFASPARFRDVVLGKNLAHMAIFACETLLVFAGVAVFYGLPSFGIAVATLCGVLFAVPLNLSIGNLLSLYSPKKIDQATFGRQRASQTTVLASFAVQFLIVGLGALAIFLGKHDRRLWLSSVLFLGYGAVSMGIYALVLGRIDGIAVRRREDLIAELGKA